MHFTSSVAVAVRARSRRAVTIRALPWRIPARYRDCTRGRLSWHRPPARLGHSPPNSRTILTQHPITEVMWPCPSRRHGPQHNRSYATLRNTLWVRRAVAVAVLGGLSSSAGILPRFLASGSSASLPRGGRGGSLRSYLRHSGCGPSYGPKRAPATPQTACKGIAGALYPPPP